MDLVSPKDLVRANPALQIIGGEKLSKILFRLLKLDLINQGYSRNMHLTPDEFLKKIPEELQITYTIPECDLKNIPAEGRFITISNHAYGGIEGIILLLFMTRVRPDYKILVNFLLSQILPLKGFFIGVNPFETHKDVRSSFGGLKDAFNHLMNNHPMGIFPSGEVSSYKLKRRAVTDREWQHSMLKFIKKARTPIIPVYFSGHNSIQFNILGFIHPVLRTAKLPSELLNKKGRDIKIRIGSPVTLEEQDRFRDISDYGKFLRMKTYALGLSQKTGKHNYRLIIHSPEPLIEPVKDSLIHQEIEQLKTTHLLFRIKENNVFCVESGKIPNILREIGRRREKTYREVGEGTNKSMDIDHYDPYFEQLFIWDDLEKQIVGGYRVGKGNQILTRYGLKGFYINSLFKIRPEFTPILNVSFELGRSFIIHEYQKKTLSLFLLWKGILYLLLKNPDYRYLLGPVSISNEFRRFSKTLCVEFLKANYFNSEFASYIHPKNPFRGKIERVIEKDIFLKHIENDVVKLDDFIHDFDPQYKTPVLLKKYLSVNAEVLGFNVDPLFNNCLDALMILDLFEVPFATIESLAKEFHDQSILERFRK
jgi:putative hemolysin